MSEHVTEIRPVSSGKLLLAIVRLNSRKQPLHVAAIQRELDRRAELKRAA